jgi:hypothetical protein
MGALFAARTFANQSAETVKNRMKKTNCSACVNSLFRNLFVNELYLHLAVSPADPLACLSDFQAGG